jgi:hypothetical protein
VRGLCAGFVSWDKWVSLVSCILWSLAHLKRDILVIFYLYFLFIKLLCVHQRSRAESDSLTHF